MIFDSKMWALFSVFLGLCAWAKDPVIYGEDNRKEIYEAPARYQQFAGSVATMIHQDRLKVHPEKSGSFKLEHLSLRKLFKNEQTRFCSDERFLDQLVPGECTGFLIGPDLLVSAGHCTKIENFCQGFRWVFDYKLSRKTRTAGDEISPDNVYSCKKVVASSLEMMAGLDYALVQLDRKVSGRSPLNWQIDNRLAPGTPLAIIGNPAGLPLKYADDAKVRSVDHSFSFLSTLDSYQGNSGSPVFNQETGLVEGLLVRGEVDFVIDPARGCLQSNRCEEGECQGEAVSTLSSIPELSLMNLLHDASSVGDEETLDQILVLGLWVDVYGKRGITPLMRAAKSMLPSVMKKLIENKADARLSDDRGETVLHYLVVNLTEKNRDSLKLLLDQGASLEAVNAQGETPLLTAARWLNLQAVKLLIEAGANTEVLNSQGESYLVPFEKAGDKEALKALRELAVAEPIID